ncbi:MAG: acyl carrier protein [Lachnospiraceae bacterium]|nr:acyl carrier protein [Lachnospiraceae bacterium]
MEKLIEILEDIKQGVDYANCTSLIDDHVFDSFDILSLVTELEEEFDIEVPPSNIVPENFNSAESLWNMICSLKENN